MNIVVNGTEINLNEFGLRSIDDNYLSYEFIVDKAGYTPNRVLSVVYTTKFDNSGMLYPGKNVKIENGMIFNVADTSAA